MGVRGDQRGLPTGVPEAVPVGMQVTGCTRTETIGARNLRGSILGVLA